MRLTPAGDAMESSVINDLVAEIASLKDANETLDCLVAGLIEKHSVEVQTLRAELAAKNAEILQLRQAYVRLQNNLQQIYEENTDA